MSNTQPPIKVRHLRLVPPLGDEPEAHDSDLVSSHLTGPWGEVLPLMRPQRPGARWGFATLVLAAAAGVWALGSVRPRVGPKTQGLSHPARALGPSFDAYAKNHDAAALGRKLAEGDTLFANDHLVLGIHNAPAPGMEAAQFAAVFAMDGDRHIAALYPPLGAEAVAMPLPQVASMALLDGPQLDAGPGPITLVAVFLRQQVALGPLMEALRAAPAPGAPLGELPLLHELSHAVVRLQQVTLAHGDAQSPAP